MNQISYLWTYRENKLNSVLPLRVLTLFDANAILMQNQAIDLA